MNRSELIARVASQNPHLYAQDAEAVVAAILDTMAATLIRGDRIELRDFGTFSVTHQLVRTRRNPRTQTAVTVQAGRAVRFRTSKALRKRLNGGTTPVRSPTGTDAVP